MATPAAFRREIMGASVRALTRLGGSKFAARLGLSGPLERAVYRGVRSGASVLVGAAAGRVAPGGEAKRLDPTKAPLLFDLHPTDEQALLVDAMRRFADEVLRPAARAADDSARAPDAVLAQGHALGLAALAVPESLGGAASERSTVTSALIAEELARGDMGLATALLAPVAFVQAVVEWGTAEQQARLLPSFLVDQPHPAALALLEPQPQFDPLRLRTRAARSDDGGGWFIWGDKALVPLASTARAFLVVAEIRGLGARLFLVDRDAPGLTIEPEPAMGLRAGDLGRLRLTKVRVIDDDVIGGTAQTTEFDLARLVDRSRIAWGAMAVGTARAVLEYVIPYCNERIAFGEPISNKQSVAFLIADIAIELEGMRLLVHRAGSRSDRGIDVGRDAALARLQCASMGMKIGSDGVQLLGGHGFVKDHPVERWYRDLRAIGVMEGALLA